MSEDARRVEPGDRNASDVCAACGEPFRHTENCEILARRRPLSSRELFHRARAAGTTVGHHWLRSNEESAGVSATMTKIGVTETAALGAGPLPSREMIDESVFLLRTILDTLPIAPDSDDELMDFHNIRRKINGARKMVQFAIDRLVPSPAPSTERAVMDESNSRAVATSLSGKILHQRTSKLDKELAAAPGLLAGIRLRVALSRELGELIMGLNDDLTTDLDTLQTVVADVITAYKSVKQLAADLQTQIDNGPPGLTAEQAAAVQSRFSAIEQQMKDAITPASTQPIDTGTSGASSTGGSSANQNPGSANSAG